MPASPHPPGLILALLLAGGAVALPAPAAAQSPWWEQAASAPAYAQAAAHAPHFDDRALWPGLTGREYFLKQTWPKGRLLVWAKPGTNGGGTKAENKRGLDVEDPQNWLEDGKTPATVVFDDRTDILLPPAEQPYEVYVGAPVRHVTVERHATLHSLGPYGGNAQFAGNVWIKLGGHIYVGGNTTLIRPAHTFYRKDDPRRQHCSQHFQFDKGPDGSVEFIGHVQMLDEFTIHGGTVIVSADSSLKPGRASSPSIQKAGVLALLDGAIFESWNNDFGTPEMRLLGGTIQGGLPDRPLTRSCRFGLAFKNHTQAVYSGPAGGKAANAARVASLVVTGGALRSFSTDLAKARLVLAPMDGQDLAPQPGSADYEKQLAKEPAVKQYWDWTAALPRGLDCWISQDSVIDGVEFDGFRKGGILCQSLDARSGWKHVFFGPHNAAAGDALYTEAPKLGKNGTY